jgi:DNA polymerase-4
MQARASGIDDRPVIADADEKQISSETTFDIDIRAPQQMHRELGRLADRTATRLRSRQLQTSCVIVKIRRADFTTSTRQRHVHPPTQETQVIMQCAAELLDEWLNEFDGAALRLLGVGVAELTESAQLELFASPESVRNRDLDAAVDRIRDKFGAVALTRADSLPQSAKAKPVLR